MTDDRPDFLEDAPDVEWPEEGDSDGPDDLGPASEDDVELIGMASTGTPVLHGAESSMLYHGEVTEDGRVTPRFDDEGDVDLGDDDDGSLSDAIAEIGERLGWDSLTEYGRDHWDGSESPKE